MSNDYNLDYKLMFEELQKRFEQFLKADDEYFDLIQTLITQNPYTDAVCENLLKLRKTDQIKALKVIVGYGELCKKLCAKYNLLVEEEF